MHIDNPGRYPALIAGFLVALVALLVSAGFHMSVHQEGVIDACITAGAGLATGAFVKPFPVPALVGFANAVVVALIAYKVPHITTGLVATVDGVIVAAAGFYIHTQGSPRLEGRVRNRPSPAE